MMDDWLQKLENELKLRGMSPKTIKAYRSWGGDYFRFVGTGFSGVVPQNVKAFILHPQSGGGVWGRLRRR